MMDADKQKESLISETKLLGGLPQPLGASGPILISFESLPKFGNPVMPLVWVDAITLAVRGGGAEPTLATMRFYAFVPEAAIEVGRFQTSINHVRSIIDILAKSADYYPTKPTETGDTK